MTIRLLGLVLM